MRYYVEINGESSLDIQGLMIQSLPSISKPLMRSKQETIDGRDGDIVTKLGYSAYDKTLKIGLWGNYDINEVIAFFNQEGTITFSNEPDKYYRFTILNRDDYVSQLDKFRTCTIALHCQPYKYKLNEEPEELENEYVEQEGTSLSFNNTLVAPMNIDLKGNTLQNGTPTPSSPIPINNVSGDNDVVVCGKNLFDDSNKLDNYAFDNTNNKVISANGYYLYYISIEANKTYVSSATLGTASGNIAYAYCNEFPQANTSITGRTTTDISILNNGTFTTPSNVKYLLIRISKTGQDITNWQIEQGNQATPYEAYNGTTYNIDLPVENLIYTSPITRSGITFAYDSITGITTISGKPEMTYAIADLINSNIPAGTYTLSLETPKSVGVGIGIRIDGGNRVAYPIPANTKSITITTTGTITSYDVYITTLDTNTTYNDSFKLQLEKGTQINSFTPYGTTPIELNKIGTYQDYIYKENDKWYLHKEIGKVVLNGSETGWNYQSRGNNVYRGYITIPNASTSTGREYALSNYFTYHSEIIEIVGNIFINSNQVFLYTDIATIDDFKTWLSTHNTIVYYVLATPTNTEITYTPLIEQLESIKNAMSKEGTTNVNQVNNDAPFILDLSVFNDTYNGRYQSVLEMYKRLSNQ